MQLRTGRCYLRLHRRGAGLALLLCAVLIACTGGAQTEVMRGLVTEPGGGPVTDLPLGLFVEQPTSEDAIAMRDVAKSATDADGRFVFYGELPEPHERFLNHDGSVNLVVLSGSEDHHVVYHVIAFPPTGHRAEWTWQDPDDSVVVRPDGAGDDADRPREPGGPDAKPIDVSITAIPRGAQDS